MAAQRAQPLQSLERRRQLADHRVPRDGDSVVLDLHGAREPILNDISNLRLSGLRLHKAGGSIFQRYAIGNPIMLAGRLQVEIDTDIFMPLVLSGDVEVAQTEGSRLRLVSVDLNGFQLGMDIPESFSDNDMLTIDELTGAAGSVLKRGRGNLLLDEATFAGPLLIQEGTVIPANTLGASGPGNGTVVFVGGRSFFRAATRTTNRSRSPAMPRSAFRWKNSDRRP